MSSDTTDMINKILLAQAQSRQNQPSFMGLEAPQDPNALSPLLGQLKQQQYLGQYQQASSGNPYADAFVNNVTRAQKGFADIGQQLGGAIGGALNGPQQAPQQQGPAFSVPPPAQDADGNVAQNLATPIPVPTPGANPQQSISNMVLAAKSYYSAQVGRGVDPDQAKVSTAQALVNWGAPGADEILDKANQQLLTNSKTRAETDKDTSQGKMDAANIQNQADEAKNRAFTQGSGTWQTTYTDPNRMYMLQTNNNGETRRVELNPSAQSAQPVDPNQAANIAAAIKAGRIPAFTGTALKTPIGMAVTNILAADPDYDGTSYPTKAKALVAFATGPEGKAVTSFNVANAHLDVFQQAASALDNGSLPAANKLLNTLGVQGGGTAQAAFDATKNVVANEIVKTIIPGQSAVGDREEVQKEVTSAQTPAQLQAVISKYQELMAGKLSGLRQQYESATGLKNFETKLSKRSIELAHQSPAYTAQFPNPTDPTQQAAPQSQGTPNAKRVYNPSTGTFQ